MGYKTFHFTGRRYFKTIRKMKNSTLIFRLITFISGVLFAWFYPFVTLCILLIILAVLAIYYLFYCLLEITQGDDYGNRTYEYTIIPRKYNFIAIFIDWLDSLPQIFKKK